MTKTTATTKTITDIRQLPFINKTNWDISPTFELKQDYKIGAEYGQVFLNYLKEQKNPVLIGVPFSSFPPKKKWTGIEHSFIQVIEKALQSGTVFSPEYDLIIRKKLIQVQETPESKRDEYIFDSILNKGKKKETSTKGDIVKINDTELQAIEYQNERVVTFKQIDAVHGRPEGTTIRNFNQNKKRLLPEKHYYFLSYQKLNEFRIIKNPSKAGMYLITEKGYLMLVKSFNDDLAWEVQDKLIDGYFRSKPTKQRSSNLGKRLTNLEQAYNRMVESNNILAKYIKDLDGFMQETFSPKQIPAQTETFSFALDDFEHDKIMKIVWYHFVETAAKKTGYVTINRWGGRTVFLKKGQLVYGQPSTAKKIGVSKNALRNRVDILIKMGKIKREKVSNYSLITVIGME